MRWLLLSSVVVIVVGLGLCWRWVRRRPTNRGSVSPAWLNENTYERRGDGARWK